MGDYASFVTEPFWRRDLPEVYDRLAAEWTRIFSIGTECVAFGGVLKDTSEAGIMCQADGLIHDLMLLVPADRDFTLWLMMEGPEREPVPYNVGTERVADERSAADAAEQEARFAAMKKRAERDTKQAEGMVNPDLDAFLGSK